MELCILESVTHNLISISQAQKRHLRIWIDDDLSNATVEKMELYQKPSGQARMRSLNTANALHGADARVCVKKAHVC